jgi:hypothetical protein
MSEHHAEANPKVDFGSFGLDIARFQSMVASSFPLPNFTVWNSSYSNLAKQLKASSDLFSTMLKTSSFQRLFEELGRNTPYNFADLLISQQLDLIEISKVFKFGTVEILPNPIILKVLEAQNDQGIVNNVLLEGKLDIFELSLDIADALKQDPKFKSYGILFDRAIAALSRGHVEASQALSTNLWDTYLCEKVGRLKMISKAKRLAPEPVIDELTDFAPIYAYASYAPAIASYEVDPRSDDYSRNGTVHHISTSSANLLNSIKSLTICGGVLARDWRLAPLPESESIL